MSAILLALLVDRTFFQSSSSTAGTGSGVAATQARSVPSFIGVDLAGANDVIVEVGARQSVVVHADSNLLGRVTTRVRSGTLVIGTTPGNLSAKSPMFVAVGVPSLDRLRLQGAGNISVWRRHDHAHCHEPSEREDLRHRRDPLRRQPPARPPAGHRQRHDLPWIGRSSPGARGSRTVAFVKPSREPARMTPARGA